MTTFLCVNASVYLDSSCHSNMFESSKPYKRPLPFLFAVYKIKKNVRKNVEVWARMEKQ